MVALVVTQSEPKPMFCTQAPTADALAVSSVELGAVSGDPFHETSVIAGLDLGEGRGALGHVVPLGGKHRFADKPLLVIGADAIGSRVVVGFGVVPHDAGDLGGRRLEETRVHVLALEHLVGHVVGPRLP